jgi:hypothetical protein
MEASVLHCVAMRGTFCRARAACRDPATLRRLSRHAVWYLRSQFGEVPSSKVNGLMDRHWVHIVGRFRVKCILEKHAWITAASAKEAQA